MSPDARLRPRVPRSLGVLFAIDGAGTWVHQALATLLVAQRCSLAATGVLGPTALVVSVLGHRAPGRHTTTGTEATGG